jgi:hypothetical protein
MDVALPLLAGIVTVASIGLLLAPRTRPASLAEAGTVLVLAALAGFGAWVMSGVTDDAVAVQGKTIYCQNPEFEDQPPADVQDRCTAQRHDRARQAWLAAAGAALFAAGATCLITAVGPLARRADPDGRPVSPGRGASVRRRHDGTSRRTRDGGTGAPQHR